MTKEFLKKRIKVTAIILSAIILLLLAGAVWNAIATEADRKKNQPMGQVEKFFSALKGADMDTVNSLVDMGRENRARYRPRQFYVRRGSQGIRYH